MKKIITLCLSLCMTAALAAPAYALEYSIDAPDDYDFGIPGPYPYGWPDVGDLTAGDMFSIAWRCLDAQLCGVAQRRKRIFLLADFAGSLAPQLLFDVFDETENSEKEVS